MRPLGEKRISRDLAELEALLKVCNQEDLKHMITGLRNDPYRKGWTANFKMISDNLPRIRQQLSQLSLNDATEQRQSFVAKWKAENGTNAVWEG